MTIGADRAAAARADVLLDELIRVYAELAAVRADLAAARTELADLRRRPPVTPGPTRRKTFMPWSTNSR